MGKPKPLLARTLDGAGRRRLFCWATWSLAEAAWAQRSQARIGLPGSPYPKAVDHPSGPV